MKIKEFKEIYEKIPEKDKAAANLILEQLTFIKSTLQKLKKEIELYGCTEHFENGKQNFLRESPASKSYIQFAKTYDTYLKNLQSLVPKEELISVEDEFDDFNK